MRSIIYVFLASMIFTNAFAVNAVLTPSFAISFIFIGHFVFYPRAPHIVLPPYLFIFWLLYTFSFLMMASGEKSLNHWFLWTFPFFSYYFVFRSELIWLFSLEEIKQSVFRYISLCTLVGSAFSILEFSCINFLDMSLDFIPRGTVQEYKPFDSGFYRARSFVEESGHFAFFLEIFGPITVYWLSRNSKPLIRAVLIVMIVLSLITTMSGVGLLFLALYLLLLVVNRLVKVYRSALTRLRFLVLFLIVLFSVNFFYPNLFEVLSGIVTAKLDLSNISNLDRVSRFRVLEELSGLSLFIGYGPAAFSTLGSETFISLLLGVLMNTGLIGSVLFTLFIFSKLRVCGRLRDQELRFSLRCSLVFASLHLLFIDIIYVPWLWVLLAIVDVIYKKEQNLKVIT